MTGGLFNRAVPQKTSLGAAAATPQNNPCSLRCNNQSNERPPLGNTPIDSHKTRVTSKCENSRTRGAIDQQRWREIDRGYSRTSDSTQRNHGTFKNRLDALDDLDQTTFSGPSALLRRYSKNTHYTPRTHTTLTSATNLICDHSLGTHHPR